MSSQQRTVHQDYVARIRYSNALPPPPCPPKLLDIPNTGLSNGAYTSAAYASRLVREQPLNIEADAELGMPLDLVGLPGVFDGDESSILAPLRTPVPHPLDKALLRPLAALGKPSSAANVSFLRRTEYISSDARGSRNDSSTSTPKDIIRLKEQQRRKRRPDLAKDDPVNIVRSIVKGFDIAYPSDINTGPDSASNVKGAQITDAEIENWSKPRHPSRPELTLLDSYPVLPDLEAFTDTGSYIVTKFISNPVAQADTYDSRLDVAILRPTEQTAESLARAQAAAESQKSGGTQEPQPLPLFNYELYLPNKDSVRGIKRKFDVDDDEAADDDELYDIEPNRDGERCFRYERIRSYETYQQTGDMNAIYDDVVIMALHDPELDIGAAPGVKEQREKRLRKAAYYYPVMQRTFIRPKRAGKMIGIGSSQMGSQLYGGEEEVVDGIDLILRSADEDEQAKRQTYVDKIEGLAVAGQDVDAPDEDAEGEVDDTF